MSRVSAETFHRQKTNKREKTVGWQTLRTLCSTEEATISGSSTAQQPNPTVQARDSLANNNCSTTFKKNAESSRRTAEKTVELLLKSSKVPTEVPKVDFQLAKEPLREACLRPHPDTEDCVSSSETGCKNFLSSQHLGRRQTCPGRLLTRTCSSRRAEGLCGRRSIGGGQEKKT